MAQLSAESAMRQGEAAVALNLPTARARSKPNSARRSHRAAWCWAEGSTAEVTATTDIMKEMDKKSTAEMNALSAAWGFKQQALQASAQGGIYSGMVGLRRSRRSSPRVWKSS